MRADDQELVRVVGEERVEGRHDLIGESIVRGIGFREWMRPLDVHAVSEVEVRLHIGARPARRPATAAPQTSDRRAVGDVHTSPHRTRRRGEGGRVSLGRWRAWRGVHGL